MIGLFVVAMIGTIGPVARVPGTDSIIPLAERITLHSTHLGEVREMDVWVPRSYHRGTARYPTMWVLDGEANLLSAVGAVQAVADANRGPEMIVVAVRNRDRGRDFTPRLVKTARPPEGMAAWGGAEKFLTFLKEEAIPAVERRYRTAPFRVLVGHSLGGLFATWAMSAAPDLFRAEVVLEPSLWWDGRSYIDTALAYLAGHPSVRHRLVAVEGTSEEGWRPVWSHLTGAAPSGVKATLIELKGESHGTMFHLGVYQGLLALFPDWVPEMRHDASRATVAALEQQYRRLSRELGYEVPIPDEVLAEAERRSMEAPPAAQVHSVTPARAQPVLGRWEGMMRVEPGHGYGVTLIFALEGDTLLVTTIAHGIAMDGGDLKGVPNAVAVSEGTFRWEDHRGRGPVYVYAARIGADGKLTGTEKAVGGPPPPPGFRPPTVTFSLERQPAAR